MNDTVTERCYLYRFFGSDGALLYVGITRDLGSRFAAHGRRSEWWNAAVRGTTDTYPSRADAELAEAIAIHAERPQYNASQPTDPKIGRLRDAAEECPDVRQLVAEIERLQELCGAQTIRIAKMQGNVDAAREAYRHMRAMRLQAETDRSMWARRYIELTDPRRAASREPLPQSPPADWSELSRSSPAHTSGVLVG